MPSAPGAISIVSPIPQTHEYFSRLLRHPRLLSAHALRSDQDIASGDAMGDSPFRVEYDAVEDAARIRFDAGGGHNAQGRRYVFDAFSGSLFLTWDAKHDRGFFFQAGDNLRTHKAFQVSSPEIGGGGRWVTVKWAYKQARNLEYCGGAPYAVRPFVVVAGPPSLVLGPGSSRGASEQLRPVTGEMCSRPDTWMRFFAHFDGLHHDSRVGEWVTFNLWYATELVDPWLVYDDVLIGVDGRGVKGWWMQFNTSEGQPGGVPRDRTAWVRNMAALHSVTKAEAMTLLERP